VLKGSLSPKIVGYNPSSLATHVRALRTKRDDVPMLGGTDNFAISLLASLAGGTDNLDTDATDAAVLRHSTTNHPPYVQTHADSHT
jgi:hypothetical protein